MLIKFFNLPKKISEKEITNTELNLLNEILKLFRNDAYVYCMYIHKKILRQIKVAIIEYVLIYKMYVTRYRKDIIVLYNREGYGFGNFNYKIRSCYQS